MKKLVLGMLALVLIMNLAQAKMVEKADLNFAIDYKALSNGEVDYAFSLMNAVDLPADIAALDTAGVISIPSSKILYNKIAYIIKKPAQNFSYENLVNEKEMQRLMPGSKVKKLSERSFSIKTKGLFGYSYKLDLEYDSEIVSTANDAAVIEAIDRARRLDGVLGQPDSTVYRHIHDFSRYSNAGVSLTRHYDLDGEATLVVTTNISSVKALFAIESIIRPSFLKETERTVELTRKNKKK